MNERKVLAADVYDTIELTSLIFGGIGAGRVWVEGEPFCLMGHFDYADPTDGAPLWSAFRSIFGGTIYIQNNNAVRAINQRKGVTDFDARVTWPEYTRELNIVRGDS